MKKIAISVDDELYRLARIEDAGLSTSISALFTDYIVRLTGSDAAETEFQRLEREEREFREELRIRGLSHNPAHNLSREEPHARHALR